MRISSPYPNWMGVYWSLDEERPIDLMQSLAQLPGVRFGEVTKGFLELPRSTWHMPTVQTLFAWIGEGPEPKRGDASSYRPKRALYPHQKDAVAFLVQNRGGLLADQMGLGKSASALVAAKQLQLETGLAGRPILVVAPVYTKEVWLQECLALGIIDDPSQFWAMQGRSLSNPNYDADIWFCHYEILKDWKNALYVNKRGRPAVAILDEAHRLRNGRSLRGKAAGIATGITSYAILLTGTPLANRPSEMWHLLTLIDGPNSWGHPIEFRQRYCGARRGEYGWVDGKATNTEEFRARIETSYLRRSLADVGIELPTLTRIPRYIASSVGERNKHRMSESRIQDIYRLFSGGGRGAGMETLRLVAELQKLTSRAKLKATSDVLTGMLEQGESAVCFTWQRATADRLGEMVERKLKKGRLEGSVIVNHGGVSKKKRADVVERFQEAETPTVLISTYDTLKEGVTLTRARHVVLHDQIWTPDTVLQAEARVYRIGQKQAATSTWMLLRDSIDELILKAFCTKAQAQADMLGFGATAAALAELGIDYSVSLEAEGARLLQCWAEAE